MKKVEYTIAVTGKPPMQVSGVGVGELPGGGYAFGLRYNRELRRWNLDHLASGLRLYSCRRKDEALELAALILPLADWPHVSDETPTAVLRPLYDVVVRFRREREGT